jgi:hypothetical protein
VIEQDGFPTGRLRQLRRRGLAARGAFIGAAALALREGRGRLDRDGDPEGLQQVTARNHATIERMKD